MMLVGMLMLAGCQATSGSGTSAVCAGLEPIRPSRSDTPETIRQVMEYNRFLERRGCL